MTAIIKIYINSRIFLEVKLQKEKKKKLPFLTQPKVLTEVIKDLATGVSIELARKNALTLNEQLLIEELTLSTETKQQELAKKIDQAVTDHNLGLERKILSNSKRLDQITKMTEVTEELQIEKVVLQKELAVNRESFLTPGEVFFQIQNNALKKANVSEEFDDNSSVDAMFIKIYNNLPQFFIDSPEEIARQKKETRDRNNAHVAAILTYRLNDSGDRWSLEDVENIGEEYPGLLKALIQFVYNELYGWNESPVYDRLEELNSSQLKTIESDILDLISKAKTSEVKKLKEEVAKSEEAVKSTSAIAA